MAVPIKSVTFWMNAFLPWSLPGTTTILQNGPYRGHSAITGPRHYCLTDQRGFSNVMTAESRMHSAVMIDFSDSTPVLTQQHKYERGRRTNDAGGSFFRPTDDARQQLLALIN